MPAASMEPRRAATGRVLLWRQLVEMRFFCAFVFAYGLMRWPFWPTAISSLYAFAFVTV
jgi:hypothetical protein